MPSDSIKLSALRKRRSWILLILVPYAASTLWLGLAVIVVPFVILNAPLGLVWLSGRTASDARRVPELIHSVFWMVFLFAIFNAKRVNIAVLRAIFSTLAVIITVNCYGCASILLHINPLKDWTPVAMLADASIPATIRQDAMTYIQQLPKSARNSAQMESNLEYWEDGAGQRAVVLNSSCDGQRWQYALIYNRNNQRVKVLRYSVGGYSSGVTHREGVFVVG